MRILQLNPYHYPYMGGIEHRIHHMSKRLAKRHEVIVVTSRLPGTEREEEIDGYRVVRLDSRFINLYNPPYVTSKGVFRMMEKLSPDIVDFHYRWGPSYTRQALRYHGKMVFTYHNTFGEGQGVMSLLSYLNDTMFMRKLYRFDKVVCTSEFVRTDNARHGFPLDRMTVVPPGVEMPSRPSTDGGFILSLGRLVHTKGLEYLMRAMTQVDADLLLAGSGPETKRLKSMSDRLGLNDRVSFLGQVSEERKQELFASCRLFVMPSLFESYGLAAAEAMSYGKPLVATNVGGLPEVVGDCGILVPPRDAGALARGIGSLLADDESRRALGSKANMRASSFSWDKRAEMLEQLYLSLLGE